MGLAQLPKSEGTVFLFLSLLVPLLRLLLLLLAAVAPGRKGSEGQWELPLATAVVWWWWWRCGKARVVAATSLRRRFRFRCYLLGCILNHG